MKADIASHSVAAEQPSTSSPTSPQSFLSIIIPTRNEAGNIEPLLNRLERALKGIDFEVIFVDDSTDDTPDVIRAKGAQIAPDVTVIERPPERRNGLGMAVVEGMRAARSEWIVVMDGDLQHPPEVIREMVDEAQAAQADLVVASRLSEGGSTAGLSWQRNLLSRGLALGMHICFPQNLRDISDPLTGFFLLRRSQISVDQLRPEGFKILLEVMIRNPHLKVAEVPFEFGKRHSGTSKANSSEMLRLMRQTLRLRLPALQPLFRFLSVGVSGIIVNSVLLFVFTELLGIYYLLSAVFATQGSTLWNFAWTESWVFRGRAQSPLNFWQRMAGFFAMNNALLVLRGPILALLVAQLGMNYLLANLVSLGALTVMRYAIADRLIWNAARGQVYHYNIHDIILVRSTHRLPELGYFRTSAFIDEPDYDVAVVADPAKYRTPESIVYDEMPGRFGFSIVINSGETTTKVYASPLVGKSPHVLYTNVIEPLLRWSFVRKGYALMHGACIALDDRALFITAQTDTHDLVAGLAEADLPGGAALNGKQGIGLNFHADVFHVCLHGKNGHGQFDAFPRGKDPGQGSQHHQRLSDRDGFFGIAIGALVACDKHHPQRADVLRHHEGVGVGAVSLKGKGPEEFHHRFEAVGLRLGATDDLFVAADAEDPLNAAAIGSHDIIVHIPGFHAQGFAGVKRLPGVGRGKAGQVEQALIDQSKGIRHRFA